jgi:PPOX class probable F420-dependent enzyme
VNPLSDADYELLSESRRAVMATLAADGRPRLVPIAYAMVPGRPAVTRRSQELVLYSALDEKPKSVDDPRTLARVRDILARPRVSVLVDDWSEDWTELRWLRLDGVARLVEPAGDDAGEHRLAVDLLRARYAQYATHRLEERPMVRITVERAVSWSAQR